MDYFYIKKFFIFVLFIFALYEDDVFLNDYQ